MFLDYWMIGVLIAVFAYGLRDMYLTGYSKAYVAGGIHSHMYTMEVLKSVLTREEMERVSEELIRRGKDKS
jgi:hypothetical protein